MAELQMAFKRTVFTWLALAWAWAPLPCAVAEPVGAPAGATRAFVLLEPGARGTQVFDNFAAVSQPGDPNPCGLLGGSQVWVGLIVSTNGMVGLDTLGSHFDTVIAVYSASSIFDLELIACDDNSAADGRRSRVVFPTEPGKHYLLAVDGVGGEQGVIQLNWCFGNPPSIVDPPKDLSLAPGETALLTVAAEGEGILAYQWRLNGVNIPNATNQFLELHEVGLTNSGSYNVVVHNGCFATNSPIAELSVAAPVLPFADSVSDPFELSPRSGAGAGSNVGAGLEPGEPLHAGRTGGASVWYSWTATEDGSIVFDLRGSHFDTLLACYVLTDPQGPLSFPNLTLLADDDDSGSFLTSRASFPVREGQTYLVAIDGLSGVSGRFVLRWTFLPAATIPRITVHPESRLALPGDTVTFAVTAEGTGLSYQWLRDGSELSGENRAQINLVDVASAQIGSYVVRVEGGGTVISRAAALELSTHPGAPSRGKYQATFGDGGSGGSGGGGGSGPITPVVSGPVYTHILSNVGASSQPNEPNHCNVLGGASRWLTFSSAQGGYLHIDTLGSQIDTLLAVYTGANILELELVECDDDSGDRVQGWSSLSFWAIPGIEYHVAVDGSGGAEGEIRLTWTLSLPNGVVRRLVERGQTLQLTAPTPAGLVAPSFRWTRDGQDVPSGTSQTLLLPNVTGLDSGTYTRFITNNSQVVINAVVDSVLVGVPTELDFSSHPTGLQIHTSAPEPFVLEASEDFRLWFPIYTNHVSGTLSVEFDPGSAARVYRARPWP